MLVPLVEKGELDPQVVCKFDSTGQMPVAGVQALQKLGVNIPLG